MSQLDRILSIFGLARTSQLTAQQERALDQMASDYLALGPDSDDPRIPATLTALATCPHCGDPVLATHEQITTGLGYTLHMKCALESAFNPQDLDQEPFDVPFPYIALTPEQLERAAAARAQWRRHCIATPVLD